MGQTSAQDGSLNGNMEKQRRKRSMPPCPCASDIALNAPVWKDMFLYTNGRCYAQWSADGPFISFLYARLNCQAYIPTPHVGRLATFESGTDYLAITSNMTYIPGTFMSFEGKIPNLLTTKTNIPQKLERGQK